MFKKSFIQNIFKVIITGFLAIIALNNANGQKSYIVGTNITLIDGLTSPYNQIGPGDTILLEGGSRRLIRIKNLTGSETQPVIITNHNGKCSFNSDYTYGISVLNCRFLRITGSGDPGYFYGIEINEVIDGSGLGVGGMSSDFEIDHISIGNCKSVGIFAKTDPDCSFMSTREKFTQYNTIIHDNYIANVGTEAMYIGSSQYFGQSVNCNGRDTLLIPSLLDGVKVYNNIVAYSGWDGIQVGSASGNCEIYNNKLLFTNTAEQYGQMSGIVIGGGSKCDCYNNLISKPKGMGISSFGLGGYRIFNNMIIDPGYNFFPDDLTRQVHGIFVSDISTIPDSSFTILNNDIINPKSDGIRFQSTLSRRNLIASNLIINPGNFDFYENGNTRLKGRDSYINLPSTSSDVILRNNFLTREFDSSGISITDFSVRPGSPLINSGYQGPGSLLFDYSGNPRPMGLAPEIGALEFNPATVVGIIEKETVKGLSCYSYPNPVKNMLGISCSSSSPGFLTINIYDLNGHILIRKEKEYLTEQANDFQIDTSVLANGLYIYIIRKGSESVSGKFIKTY